MRKLSCLHILSCLEFHFLSRNLIIKIFSFEGQQILTSSIYENENNRFKVFHENYNVCIFLPCLDFHFLFRINFIRIKTPPTNQPVTENLLVSDNSYMDYNQNVGRNTNISGNIWVHVNPINMFVKISDWEVVGIPLIY